MARSNDDLYDLMTDVRIALGRVEEQVKSNVETTKKNTSDIEELKGRRWPVRMVGALVAVFALATPYVLKWIGQV